MKHAPIKSTADGATVGDSTHGRAENAAKSGPAQRQPRRLIALAAHVLRDDDKVTDASVLDMSYEGCRVRSEDYLWPGEKVKLSVPRRGVIDAIVQWSAEGEAGLVFDDSDKGPAEVAKVARKAVRFPADSQVSLRRLGNLKFHVKVRDISPDGCRIDLVERPAVGETLHIKFQGLDVLECKVRWVEGYIAGLEFVRPIHPAVFDLLMHRLKTRR